MQNWQDLRPRERMEHLLRTGHLSDCSFVVYDDDGKKIVLKCHKFVLMNVSPVFERMFEGDFEESKVPENIVLDDVSGSDFRNFIEYLYWHDNRRLDTYELPMLQTLIYLSKKFMVSFMTTNCLSVIKRRLAGLDADITVDLFEYAHQIEDDDLINIIKAKFLQNAEVFIGTSAVLDLSSEIFLEFIEHFYGVVGDKLRFDIIDRYCRVQGLLVTSDSSSPKKTDMASHQCDDKTHITKRLKQTPVASSENAQDVDEINKETKEITSQKDEKENDVKNDTDGVVHSEKENAGQREQQKKNEYISKLLKTIKFTSMSSYDFCSGPGASDLLTLEKKFELLSSICIAEYKMRLISACRCPKLS